MITLSIETRVTPAGKRFYPQADGKPFYYQIPGNPIKQIVSYGSWNEASNLLWSETRTIVYMDATDSREPFKVAAVYAESGSTAVLTNFERLTIEAKITDPKHPGYNSDLDMVIPYPYLTGQTYRTMILAGLDPNVEADREEFFDSYNLGIA